jgi:hypothetical protein
VNESQRKIIKSGTQSFNASKKWVKEIDRSSEIEIDCLKKEEKMDERK